MRIAREVLSLPRAIEPDCEIFAIGDIHGRSDLLDALLQQAAREPRRARGASCSPAISSIVAPIH